MKAVKEIFIFLFLTFAANFTIAQSWERLITDGGSSGNEIFSDMHIDNEGNVYLTGSFSGSATFGNILLTSNGATDFFVVKYDSSGSLIYATSGGSPSSDLSNAIVSDNNGNAYITGLYSGFMNIAGTTLLINGPTDVFTVKVDTIGNFVWAKKAGGLFDVYGSTYEDRGLDIAFDNSNGIYVAGVTSGQSMTFGPFLHGPGQGDATDFVGKYDLHGNEQWIVSGSDPNGSPTGNLSISKSLEYNPISNSIILGGYNSITVSIGGGGISKNSNLFFRQIFPNGSLGWFRQFGGTSQEEVYDLALDGSGNIYATGLYNGTLEIPLGTVIATSINDGQNSEDSDAFILKLNPNASTVNYIKTVAGSQDVDGLSITSSPTGTVYVSGKYKGTPGVDNVALNPKGEYDIFLLRIDSLNNLNWVEVAGGNGEDAGVNVVLRNDEKIVLSGGFSSISQFGDFSRTSLGFSDAFLANLDCKPGKPALQNNLDTILCIGDSSEIIPLSKFGTSYTYNLVSGGIVDSSGNTLKIFWNNPGNHQLQIIPNNVCGQGKIKTIQFAINDVPGSTLIAGDTNICIGLGTYVATNSEADNFNWSLNGGGSLVPLGNQALVSWSNSGQYTLKVNGLNACGIGQEDSLIVSVAEFPFSAVSINGSSSSCFQSDTFTILPQNETTYSWDLSSGGTIQSFDTFSIVNWNQEGSHIIRVTPSNICGTGSPSSKIVSVIASPSKEEIIGDTLVCIGSSSFSLPSLNGVNYNWSVSGGGTLLNLGNNAIVNWTSSGNYFVSASIQNSCGISETDTINVAVKSAAIQPGNINGSSQTCLGTNTYSVIQQSDQSYEWTLSSGGNLTFVNNQASINWTQSGFHTISVRALNSCGTGLTRDLVVEVKDVPDQPGVIFGNNKVCLGLQNYNVFSESGVNYIWSISGGGQIFPSGNSASINWTLPGTYDLIVTPFNSCGNGTPRILQIEVNDVPDAISGIIGIDTVCLGSQIYTVENPQTGSDLNYNWSLSGGGVIAPNGNSATVNWSTAGTYTLTVQAQNSCGFGQAFSIFINVKNTNEQITNISGDDLVCLDTTIYDVPLINGFNYNWTLSGGGLLNADSNSAEVIWQNTGNYTLSVTSSDGCTKTLTIEVKDIPSIPSVISGDTVVCIGTKSYAVSPVIGQTFNWSLSGGGNINAFGNAAIADWNSTGVFNVEVSGSNFCGTGPIRTQLINVLTTPSAPFFNSADTIICNGQTEIYSVDAQLFESYSWTLDRGGLLSPSDSIVSVQWLDTGIATLTVSGSNLCGTGLSSVLAIDVDDVPSLPIINGPNQVCLDTSLYTSSFDNSVFYNWSISGTASLIDSINSTQIAFTDTGFYNLNLSLANSCGTSSVAQKKIEVFQIPSKPQLSQGDTIVCLGFSSYQVIQTPSQTYNWAISGGGAINALGNSATINWTNTGNFQVYIQATNLCGSGPVDTIDVEVRTTPAQPSTISGPANVCLDSAFYAVNTVNNLSYSWTLSSNGNLISGDSSTAIVNWFTTGVSVLSVTASNLCGSSPSQSKSINIEDIPGLPIITSGDTLVCLGNEIYSIQSSAGLSYNWNLPGGGNISSNTNQATVFWNQTDNWNLISSLSNFCGTGPEDTLSIRVKTLPDTANFINPDTLVCLSNIVYSVNFEPEVNYTWSLNGGGSLSTVNNQAFVTWNNPGVYSLRVNPVNICGAGPLSTVQVDVNTVPNTPQFLNLDTLACIGPESYIAIPQSNSNFLWNLSGGGGSSSNGNQFNVNWTSTGIFDIELSAFNFCGTSPKIIKSISVNELPPPPVLISANVNPCLNNETYIISANNSSNQIWNLSGGGLLNANGDSAVINWLSPGTQNIEVIAENYCGLSQALTIIIDVNDIPERPTGFLGPSSVCFGDSALYSVLEEPGLTYDWRTEANNPVNSDSSAALLIWNSIGEQLLYVKAKNNCGSSPETDFEVNVRSVPTFQGNILGDDKICLGSNSSYTVSFGEGILYDWKLNDDGELSAQDNSALIQWNDSGEYILSLTASNSCGSSIPVTKTIIVDVFPEKPQITSSGDSLFSNNIRDNFWYLNGEKINNKDSPFIIPKETGQYTLQIINSCGESEISDFISFYGGQNLENEIYLFPNPANIAVQVKIPLNLRLNSLAIINAEGRQIINYSLKGGSVEEIYLDNLLPGVYFVELIIDGQGRFYKKLIVN